MAECGERYEDLVRAADERSPSKPCTGLWCNEDDAENWQSQVDHIFGLVRAAWNDLHDAESAPRPRLETTRNTVEAFEQQYATLPEPSVWMAFGAAGAGETVAAMIACAQQGVCALDLLNTQLEELGKTPLQVGPSNPKPTNLFGDKEGETNTWVWVGVGAGVLAVAGVAAFVVFRRREQAMVILPTPTTTTTTPANQAPEANAA